MDKVKDTLKKGFSKEIEMKDGSAQGERKDTLQTTWPTREQHTSMTGGTDPHLGRASQASDITGPTGKDSMGQPSNKP
ncbi:hypothetical protein N656DRAFT_801058 [Canariomyces notabilis]|uniref:Uncharacterized protein n=1 Tax=Canariomyces notabilis TaxID=2074819 RepID=A0AAN6QFG3_9PEZI|nr:hypothetical protein N656DRAFT_801058 [Canariomyces arenarius]